MEKSLIKARRSRYFPASQPTNEISHFSGGYIFQRTRASVQSGSSICAGLSIFNVPIKNILNVLGQYLLFIYQSTGSTVLGFRQLCYVMLLAAADPSSYNLFSGLRRSFCFIIE